MTQQEATIRLKTLRLTLKFNYFDRSRQYDISSYNNQNQLFHRIRADCEQFVRDISTKCLKNPRENLDNYQLYLYCIHEQIPHLTLIQTCSDIENNCTIEIVLIRIKNKIATNSLQECSLTIPQHCSRCGKSMVGDALLHAVVCRSCDQLFHGSCAPYFTHYCVPGEAVPQPKQTKAITRTSLKQTGSSESSIDAQIPFFIKNENIYRRAHMKLTTSSLHIETGSKQYFSLPLENVQNVYIVHQINNFTKHRFEVVCSNLLICIGKRSESDDARLITDQFCSTLILKWDTVLANIKQRKKNLRIATKRPEIAYTNPPTHSLRPSERHVSLYKFPPEECNQQDMHDIYEFTNEPIGQGSFGFVVGAMRRSTKQKIAVKYIDYSKCSPSSYEERYAEIDILCKLKHPNILKFEACFARQEGLYIFTERMDKDLYEYITSNGYLSETVSKFIIYQILTAVAYLHETDICHCDIKPENLLINFIHDSSLNNRSIELVKLADFGYARIILDHSLRRTQVGTKVYMSPELYHNERGYNKLTDIWAVGIVLYACLSGKTPYDHNNVAKAEEYVNNSNYMYSEWIGISSTAKDFISSNLLVTNPQNRTKANEALRHEWFKDESLYKNLKLLEILCAKKYPSVNAEQNWLTKDLIHS
ncbi:unnamed protein product [Didymodactylos carnosus]|uniref:Protein kinase domain-containing protein n=1 Tax=Didymodactylos carnosus TaxID=1234261 RepID=A0A813S9F2_9BILA|nr:unnamed protein product [Didymodactylos carnosus]CAF3578389.1 unnamed protein product [Didymodactylos carnosus]